MGSLGVNYSPARYKQEQIRQKKTKICRTQQAEIYIYKRIHTGGKHRQEEPIVPATLPTQIRHPRNLESRVL